MAVNYHQAARRVHVDAETLFSNQRLGTADHLFGIAAECALKAILVGLGVIPRGQPPAGKSGLKEHINKLWAEYNTVVAGRGVSSLALPPSAPFSGWEVGHRYEDDLTFSHSRVSGHRAATADVFAVLEAAQVAGYV